MKKVFLVITLILFANISQSQSAGENDIILKGKAPITNEFKIYGDIPINEYSGVVNINIPIYNITLDNVNIPISLNKSSTGIKVLEEAGIVGLGWDFEIPKITQEIKSFDDYDVSTRFQKLPDYVGNPVYSYRGLDHPISNLITRPTNVNTYDGQDYNGSTIYFDYPLFFTSNRDFVVSGGKYREHNYEDMILGRGYHVDSEPDIFRLYINGIELVMITNRNNLSDFLPENRILDLIIINGRNEFKVELIQNVSTNFSSVIKGIKVTDPNGNIYFFDQIEIIKTNVSIGGLHMVRQFNPGGTNPEPTSRIYKLSKITTFLGKNILFNYSERSLSDLPKKSDFGFVKKSSTSTNPNASMGFYTGTVINDYYSTNGAENSIYDHYFHNLNPNSNESFSSAVMFTNYNYKILEKITFENTIIDFSYSNRDDSENVKLDTITIKNSNNNIINQFNFNYDYFACNESFNGFEALYINNSFNCKRLKLLSLKEVGKNPYLFVYNNTLLPKKTSYSIDYWGNFNGKNNISLIPSLHAIGLNQYSNNNNNNFSSDINYMKAGSLEKIIYPSGGYTIFEYEPHVFDYYLYQNYDNPKITEGFGLRVKSITDSANNSSIEKKKTFNYINGKVLEKAIIHREYTESIFDKKIYLSIYGKSIQYLNHSTGVIELNLKNITSNSDNGFVGYDIVETIYSGGENGKTTRKYINNISELRYLTSDARRSDEFFYIVDRDYKSNGTLKREEFYDANNNLKMSKEYEYKNLTFPNSEFYGLKIKQSRTFISYTGLGGANIEPYMLPEFDLVFYPIFRNSNIKVTETTSEFFDQNKSITSIKNFNYDNYNRIVEEKTFLNNVPNRTIVNSINYEISDSNNLLRPNNIITYEVDNLKTTTLHSKILKYNNNGIVNLLSEEWDCPRGQNEYSLELSDNCVKSTLNLYDNHGNILDYTNKEYINNVILWGYQQTQPIAKIENATYAQVQSALAAPPHNTTVEAIQAKSNLDNDRTVGATGSEGVLRTALNTLRSSLLNSQVTTYTYDPLIGVTSITDPSGYTVYYVYDTFNRLQYIKNKDGEVIEQYRYNYKKEALLTSTSSSSSSVNAGQSVTFTTSATGGSGSFTYKWTVSNANLNQVYTNTTGVLTLTTGISHAPNFTAVCEVTDTQTQEVVTTTTQVAVSVGYPALSVGDISASPSGYISVGDDVTYMINVSGGSGNYRYVWSKTNNQGQYPLGSGYNNVGVYVTVYDCYSYTITCEVTDLTTNETVTKWLELYVSSGCREGEVEQ